MTDESKPAPILQFRARVPAPPPPPAPKPQERAIDPALRQLAHNLHAQGIHCYPIQPRPSHGGR